MERVVFLCPLSEARPACGTPRQPGLLAAELLFPGEGVNVDLGQAKLLVGTGVCCTRLDFCCYAGKTAEL